MKCSRKNGLGSSSVADFASIKRFTVILSLSQLSISSNTAYTINNLINLIAFTTHK